ncbi:unnamed protein product [Agarophyton chilense]
MQLARDLAPDPEPNADAAAPPRTPQPKWSYPQGSPQQFAQGESNPWAVWNDASARAQREQLQPRDPKAETDFWRGAARDLAAADADADADADTDSPNSPPSRAEHGANANAKENGNEEESALKDGSSADVWRMAREVTGEMVDMQSRLRGQLEQYDSVQNVDEYRQIARELLGPPPEVGDDSRPVRRSADFQEGAAEAEQLWDPDVDWMQFDHVQRELRNINNSDDRHNGSEEEPKPAASEDYMQQQRSFDGTDNQQLEEQAWDTATFTDQSTAPAFSDTNSMPGFIRNRFMRSGTYGASWAGAEREAEHLRRDGVPLRDPKADAEQWRSVARELDLDVGDDLLAVDEQSTGAGDAAASGDSDATIAEGRADGTASWASWGSGSASWTSANAVAKERDPKKEVDMWRSSARELTGAEAAPAADQADEPSSSSWASWRNASASWELANETAEARDPKKEVDMWRSSARELTSPDSPDATVSGNSGDTEGQASAWDSWRNANERWMHSLDDGGMKTEAADNWSPVADTQSDWGANLGGKTSSERSAWQAWENAVERPNASVQQEWWKMRTDAVQRPEPKATDRSSEGIDQWRAAAKEVSLEGFKEQAGGSAEDVNESKTSRLANDSSINAWKSVARDLTTEPLTEDEDGS